MRAVIGGDGVPPVGGKSYETDELQNFFEKNSESTGAFSICSLRCNEI